MIEDLFTPFVPGQREPTYESLRMFTPLRASASGPLSAECTLCTSIYVGDKDLRIALTDRPATTPDWIRDRFIVPMLSALGQLPAGYRYTVWLDEWLEDVETPLLDAGASVLLMPHPSDSIGISWRLLGYDLPGWKIFTDADDPLCSPNELALITACMRGSYGWFRRICSSVNSPVDGDYFPFGGQHATRYRTPDMAKILAEFIEWFPGQYAAEIAAGKTFIKPFYDRPLTYGFDEQFLSRWAYAIARQQRTVAFAPRNKNRLLAEDMAECPETTFWWV